MASSSPNSLFFWPSNWIKKTLAQAHVCVGDGGALRVPEAPAPLAQMIENVPLLWVWVPLFNHWQSRKIYPLESHCLTNSSFITLLPLGIKKKISLVFLLTAEAKWKWDNHSPVNWGFLAHKKMLPLRSPNVNSKQVVHHSVLVSSVSLVNWS